MGQWSCQVQVRRVEKANGDVAESVGLDSPSMKLAVIIGVAIKTTGSPNRNAIF
jgi:hypothetical protein